jgi:hypothetical protein
MSESKFKKAVEIVQNLPKEGPLQPTSDDKLYVSLVLSSPVVHITDHDSFQVLQVLQARYAQNRQTCLDQLNIADFSH